MKRFKARMRNVILMLMMIMVNLTVHAAGDGGAGIEQATTMIRGYFDKGVSLMYVVAAVIGLIGAIKVYSKWSSGDPDTTKIAAGWFGACVFLAVSAAVLRAFFL